MEQQAVEHTVDTTISEKDMDVFARGIIDWSHLEEGKKGAEARNQAAKPTKLSQAGRAKKKAPKPKPGVARWLSLTAASL